MSEKRVTVMKDERFTVMKKFDGSYVICDNGKMLVADDCCDLLNEQQDIIKSKDSLLSILAKENEQLREELNNLKKDETMLYHYYTLARYGGDGV